MNTYTKMMTVGGRAFKLVIKFNQATEKLVEKIDGKLKELEADHKHQKLEVSGLVPDLGKTAFGQDLRELMSGFMADIRMVYMVPVKAVA